MMGSLRGPEHGGHPLTLWEKSQHHTRSSCSQKVLKTRHGLLFWPSASPSLYVVGLGGVKGQRSSYPPSLPIALGHPHLGEASQEISPGPEWQHCHPGLPCVGWGRREAVGLVIVSLLGGGLSLGEATG